MTNIKQKNIFLKKGGSAKNNFEPPKSAVFTTKNYCVYIQTKNITRNLKNTVKNYSLSLKRIISYFLTLAFANSGAGNQEND